MIMIKMVYKQVTFQEGMEFLECHNGAKLGIVGYEKPEWILNSEGVLVDNNGMKQYITAAFLRNDFFVHLNDNWCLTDTIPIIEAHIGNSGDTEYSECYDKVYLSDVKKAIELFKKGFLNEIKGGCTTSYDEIKEIIETRIKKTFGDL